MTGSESRPFGLGPVFTFECITSSRRWQAYALRSLFVAMLLGSVIVVFLTRPEVRTSNFKSLAQIGELFYFAVVGTQLTLVLLAAPAATAGAICLDRARGSLTHLLVTDLTDSEIVLGKLAARLVPVLGLLACTLPMMFLLTLLGGVDPDALLGAFLISIGLAVLGCSLALVFSLYAGKTHEALLATYAVWVLWLLGRTMAAQLNSYMGWNLLVLPKMTDPYILAFAPYWSPKSVSLSDYLSFLAATLTASALLALLAVFRLRTICTRENVKKKKPSRILAFFPNILRAINKIPNLPGPSLDRNPVLWREWHRNRPTRFTRLIGSLFIVLASTFSLIAILTGDGATAAWTNGFQVSVGLLILSVSAATSLAEERVRGSLDVLMATPLPTRQIVLGKWLGAFRVVPLLAILPSLVILFGSIKTGVWYGAILMCAFVIASGAAVTSLGLLLATWCSRLGRAVGLTVTLYVFMCVGWLFIAMMARGPGHSEGIMMGSPFFWAGELSFELCNARAGPRHIGWGLAWIAFYAIAAHMLLILTLLTFNRCLGRVESNFPRIRPRRKDPVWLSESSFQP